MVDGRCSWLLLLHPALRNLHPAIVMAKQKSPAEKAEVLTVEGREVTISNPQKVLFPKPGHTKLDLVQYYLAVADGALRGAGGRPNVLVRYPDGIDGEFFYQKRAPTSRPDWVRKLSWSNSVDLTHLLNRNRTFALESHRGLDGQTISNHIHRQPI